MAELMTMTGISSPAQSFDAANSRRHQPRSFHVAYEHRCPLSCVAPYGVQIQKRCARVMYAGMERIARACLARAARTAAGSDSPIVCGTEM